MTDERRYGEEEVAAIFEAASGPAASRKDSRSASDSEQGLTLSELQSIGREVGISPDRIAEAAAALRAQGRIAAAAYRARHAGVGGAHRRDP